MIVSCATPIGSLPELGPTDVHCKPECFVECGDVPELHIGITAVQLAVIAVMADSHLDLCNKARRMCVKCIQTGRKVGAIR